MSLNRRFLASLVACLFLVAGCGDKKDKASSGEAGAGAGAPAATTGSAATGSAATTEAPASPPPPAAMMDLVPEGTVAVVYIRNVKALEDGVRRIASSVDGTKAPHVEFSELASELGVDGADVEWSRPAAIAVTQSAGSPDFGKTVIVPVKDEKAIAAKVKAKMADATVDAAGGFVAITSEAPYKRAGPPPQFKSALPAGDVVVRIDVAALWKTFGPMATSQADAMLEQIGGAAAAGGVDPAASLKPMLDGLKSVIEASSVWDLAFRIDGTAVEMDLTARFAPGSKPAVLDSFAKADLVALARAVTDEGPMMFAAAMDMPKLWAAMLPMVNAGLEAYPPADRANMKKMFDAMPEAMKTLGHGMAASMAFGAQGMSGSGVMETSDAAAYVKAWMQVSAPLDAKEAAIKRTPPEERMIEGVKVTTYRLQVDTEKLKGAPAAMPGGPDPAVALAAVWGKDGMRVSVAELGNRVLVVLGSDDQLARGIKAAKAGAASTTPLAKALDAAGPGTVGYMRIDAAAMARDMMKIMGDFGGKDMPPVKAPSGDPVIITGIVNTGPNELRTRLSLDVGKLAKMIEGMKPK